MMKTTLRCKRFLALLMAVSALFCHPSGEALASAQAVAIYTEEDWVSFAARCRLDSYSEGLQAELMRDLDLTGIEAASVPIFCGSFNGNGHAVSGMALDTEADDQGLFRIVGENASIRNLTVSAEISGAERISQIGVLCGINRGLIENCNVSGAITAHENIGGVAGINEETGTITGCTSSVRIEAAYKAGGAAGSNFGTIAGSSNSGSLNLGANEAATNIGGIAGVNEGVMTDCENTAEIGYLHTGYNVGGIAGLSRGFLKNCANRGHIHGRRDTGGIAGQMEPSYELEYGQNAMKLLDDRVSDFTEALSQTVSNLQTAVDEGASGLNGLLAQIGLLMGDFSSGASALISNMAWVSEGAGYLDEIRDEIQLIREKLPDAQPVQDVEVILRELDEENPSEWADLMQQLKEKLSELSSQLEGYGWFGEGLRRISVSFGNFSSVVIRGFQQFGDDSAAVLQNTSSQLSVIAVSAASLLEDAKGGVGAVREDVNRAIDSISGLQAGVEEVLRGKVNEIEDLSETAGRQADGMVVSCENTGGVSGDYNIGGIVGNLSKELTLDQEIGPLPTVDDVLFTDTTTYVRATIYDCENTADISSKYDYTGGIVGYANRGAVIQSRNGGNISAGRDYAGGIAGYTAGTIRDSGSLGALEAVSYVGGIAGDAKRIENCAAIPVIEPAGAYVGAIAGRLSESGQGNLYVHDMLGGIDNISYSGVAEPVAYEELLRRENLPAIFKMVTVRFEVDGELVQEAQIPYGEGAGSLPKVEKRGDRYWRWDAFDMDSVRRNLTVGGEWHNLITTLSSGEEPPQFLVEGAFDDTVRLDVMENHEVQEESLASYSLRVTDDSTSTMTVRYRTEEEGVLFEISGQGRSAIPYTRDGRYIVFELPNGSAFMYTARQAGDVPAPVFLIGGAVLASTLALLLRAWRKRKRGAKKGSAAKG